MFSKCFRGECMWQLWKNLKGWWCGTLTSTILITFQFHVTGMGSVGMHQLNYNILQYDSLEIFVPISPLPPACFSLVFLLFVLLLLRKKSNLPPLQQDGSWFKEAISRIRNILLAWNLAGVFVHFITSFNLPDSGL